MNWIGQSLLRKEDQRFLTGTGNFVSDIADRMPGVAHLVVLRSPHACARINAIDTEKAARLPGVLTVLTGHQLQEEGIGGLPCAWPVHSSDGTEMAAPEHPVLVSDYALHVGDPVAAVVAETRHQAEAAVELVEVDYQVLPAQTDLSTSLDDDAAIVHPDLSSNVTFDWTLGDATETARVMGEAAHVIKLDLVQNRINAAPIETRRDAGPLRTGPR